MWTRFTQPATTPARVAPPDAGRTTQLSTTWLPADMPTAGEPLAPAADPDTPTVLTPMQPYLVGLIRPATGRRDSWIGGSCPPGWEWVQREEYEVVAGHIRIAALKATVEHGLLHYLSIPHVWLAVRWAGYVQPTFYVNAAWLDARLARLESYAAAWQTLSDR